MNQDSPPTDEIPSFPGLHAAKILILGGSGHLGSATARLLAHHGAQIFLTYFSQKDSADIIAKDLNGAQAVHVGHCDFRSHRSVANTVAEAVKRLGGLHAMVCTVGSQRRRSHALTTFKAQDFTDLLATQFEGVVYACRETMKHLAPGGSIVIISSIIASRGYIPGQSLHAALKAGVEGFVRHAAYELAPNRIRVNAVAPGYIGLGENEPGDPKVLRDLVNSTPLRRAGSTREVAAAVCFLLSSASAYTTGTVLHVDGGLFL